MSALHAEPFPLPPRQPKRSPRFRPTTTTIKPRDQREAAMVRFLQQSALPAIAPLPGSGLLRR